ncbi:MAG: hypothetical protein P4L22_04175 [Candidatus Babeliales bacterium]|nr:hypothetical protein [Candidatus Babeliales bacterium]
MKRHWIFLLFLAVNHILVIEPIVKGVKKPLVKTKNVKPIKQKPNVVIAPIKATTVSPIVITPNVTPTPNVNTVPTVHGAPAVKPIGTTANNTPIPTINPASGAVATTFASKADGCNNIGQSCTCSNKGLGICSVKDKILSCNCSPIALGKDGTCSSGYHKNDSGTCCPTNQDLDSNFLCAPAKLANDPMDWTKNFLSMSNWSNESDSQKVVSVLEEVGKIAVVSIGATAALAILAAFVVVAVVVEGSSFGGWGGSGRVRSWGSSSSYSNQKDFENEIKNQEPANPDKISSATTIEGMELNPAGDGQPARTVQNNLPRENINVEPGSETPIDLENIDLEAPTDLSNLEGLSAPGESPIGNVGENGFDVEPEATGPSASLAGEVSATDAQAAQTEHAKMQGQQDQIAKSKTTNSATQEELLEEEELLDAR